MRRSYVVVATLLLALALFVGAESLKLRYYTALGPGPGFFPFWLAIALGAAAIGMLMQTLLKTPEPMPGDFFPTRAGLLKMGAVALAMVGTIALLEPLGFRLTMLLMYLFLLCSLGQRGWIVTPLVALAGSFGVYHLFVHWLNVPLPIGSWGI